MESTGDSGMKNPFDVDADSCPTNKEPLLNIATSTVAPTAVAECLAKVRQSGSEMLSSFIEQRISSNEVDFFAPITRPKLQTFASLNKLITTKEKEKTCTAHSDRQLFSKLAVIGQAREVDLHELLTYELSSIPLSLFNLDGSMRKNAKSATLSWLEQDLAMEKLPSTDEETMLIVDFMAIIHMVCADKLDCGAFGDLSALNILLRIFNGT